MTVIDVPLNQRQVGAGKVQESTRSSVYPNVADAMHVLLMCSGASSRHRQHPAPGGPIAEEQNPLLRLTDWPWHVTHRSTPTRSRSHLVTLLPCPHLPGPTVYPNGIRPLPEHDKLHDQLHGLHPGVHPQGGRHKVRVGI